MMSHGDIKGRALGDGSPMFMYACWKTSVQAAGFLAIIADGYPFTFGGVTMLEYSMLYPLNTPTRCAMKLDGMWKFRLDWDGCGDTWGLRGPWQ